MVYRIRSHVNDSASAIYFHPSDNHFPSWIVIRGLRIEMALRHDIGKKLGKNDERENQGERVNIP